MIEIQIDKKKERQIDQFDQLDRQIDSNNDSDTGDNNIHPHTL